MKDMGVGNYAVLNFYPNGNGHFWKCVLSVRISGASGTAFKLIQLIVRLTVSSWVITIIGFQKKLFTKGMTFCFLQDTQILGLILEKEIWRYKKICPQQKCAPKFTFWKWDFGVFLPLLQKWAKGLKPFYGRFHRPLALLHANSIISHKVCWSNCNLNPWP